MEQWVGVLVLCAAACGSDDRESEVMALEETCGDAQTIVRDSASCTTDADLFCDLAGFLSDIGCAETELATWRCIQEQRGSGELCAADSPCIDQSNTAEVCTDQYCQGEAAYETGCIELYGCPPDCPANSCGQDDRCGGVCTACDNGTCNVATSQCVFTDDGARGDGCACDPEPAGNTALHRACSGDADGCAGSGFTADSLRCLAQQTSGDGTCQHLCNESDAGTGTGCPDGLTCEVSAYQISSTQTWYTCQ